MSLANSMLVLSVLQFTPNNIKNYWIANEFEKAVFLVVMILGCHFVATFRGTKPMTSVQSLKSERGT